MESAQSEDIEQAWSLLAENDLGAVNMCICSPRFQGISAEMVLYLASRLIMEARHRDDLAALPPHKLPWSPGVCSNAELYRLFLASLALRRACCHSECLQQWASTIHDAICSAMGQRLLERI